MIKIENTAVTGFEAAIRGMRNPKNSWDRSDSDCLYHAFPNFEAESRFADIYRAWNEAFGLNFKLGENDKDLAMRLNAGGPVHAKYRRMIVVWADVTAPLYWWKEYDTYKVGTVANSCSTMHKIHSKEFTLDDFSTEHLLSMDDLYPDKDFSGQEVPSDKPLIAIGDDCFCSPMGVLTAQIKMLNRCRTLYLETKDKTYWWQLIQLLPSSYNQKRTVMLNYEVLHNIYISRKDHKLDEWHQFCDWIGGLPYAESLIY